jgi:hypothetical protein
MKNTDLNIKSLQPIVGGFMHKLQRYAVVLTFLLFTSAYGYVLFTVNSLNDPDVSDTAVAEGAESLPTPRIDEEAVEKLQSLKDNSVNVQSLFDQNRTNPFSE